MIPVGHIVHSDLQEAVIIPKGTRIFIRSPEWVDSNVHTHIELLIELEHDTAMWTCSCSERLVGQVVAIRAPVIDIGGRKIARE